MNRTSALLTGLIMFPGLHAQLVNPGFENGATGWQFTCPQESAIIADAPPSGGSSSLRLRCLSSTLPDCYHVDGIQPMAYQPLTGAQNGTVVQVSFWTKAIGDQPNDVSDVLALMGIGWSTSATSIDFAAGTCAWGSSVGGGSDQWEPGIFSCTIAGLPPGETPVLAIGGHAYSNTNGHILFDNVNITLSGSGTQLSARAWLDGCYVQAQGLMRDDLRAAGLVPSVNPYGGAESVAPSVLAVTGPDAIVDWVRLELRTGDMNTPQTVAVRHALLQRDGDIVDTDGTSPVTFNAGPGNYHVALLHRNHLGVVTGNSVPLSATPTVVDLRSPSTLCHTRPAPDTDLPRRTVGGTRTLWAGNVIGDDRVRYTGASNDRDPVLVAIGGSVPTNTLSGQYRVEDVNLDGTVKYAGTGNDRDLILQTIGGLVPTAVRIAQVP